MAGLIYESWRNRETGFSLIDSANAEPIAVRRLVQFLKSPCWNVEKRSFSGIEKGTFSIVVHRQGHLFVEPLMPTVRLFTALVGQCLVQQPDGKNQKMELLHFVKIIVN
ncbi:MAG: hypothetical protein V2J07_01605 [Anaerolineae bacterium]|jgi:hypothetical protein|nr:hypothetical protein [Anaerolineae bacterium]